MPEEDKELMFTRVILCELVQRAMEDAAIDETRIALKRNREMVVAWKEDAIRFIKTSAFERIVNILGHDVAMYRRKAYL